MKTRIKASRGQIVVRGDRTHNLKNVDLTLPSRSLIVMTGVSGSGKSSLAFDTIYAEGQRRYVESLSAYARQFLERMEKPDVDRIDGIAPAIAIRQKNSIRNPRSTVGTTTEIHDYMRLLYARVGRTYCRNCGREVVRETAEVVASQLRELPTGTRLLIGFDLPVVETSVVGTDAVEVDGGGAVWAIEQPQVASREKSQASVTHLFSERFECRQCGIPYEDPQPRLFSFNNPFGACPTCHGFGNIIELDMNLVVPEPSKSIQQGAIEPWSKPHYRTQLAELKRAAKKAKIRLDVPWSELSDAEKTFIVEGSEDFDGVRGFFRWLERKKYKVHVRVFLSRYRGYLTCPDCGGARLRREARDVRVARRTIDRVSALTVQQAQGFFSGLELSDKEQAIADNLLKEIRKRLEFLSDVGLDYLSLDRLSSTLSGGEAQRINLATSLGSALVGTLYVLDEPSIGLHPRDNLRLIAILCQLRDQGNTVIVVEHDADMIKVADHIVHLGLGAGEQGGRVVFSGTLEGLMHESRSLTSKYLRRSSRFRCPRAAGVARASKSGCSARASTT